MKIIIRIVFCLSLFIAGTIKSSAPAPDLLGYSFTSCKDNLCSTYSVYKDNITVGHIQYSTRSFTILTLEVDSFHRNKGLGAKLLEYAVNDLRALNGNQNIRFVALPFGNKPLSLAHLINFYKKCGAQVTLINRSNAHMIFPAAVSDNI